jgi:hypothetical protein
LRVGEDVAGGGVLNPDGRICEHDSAVVRGVGYRRHYLQRDRRHRGDVNQSA